MATAIPAGHNIREMTRNMENLLGTVDRMGVEYNNISTQIGEISKAYNGQIEAQKKSNSLFSTMQKNVKNYIATGQGLKDVISFYSGAVGVANEEINTERNLTVTMRQRLGANEQQINSVKELAKEQEKIGVVSDEVQMSGAAQLSNYVGSADTINTLLPAMNNMAVSMAGTDVSNEAMTDVSNVMGAAMTGDLSGIEAAGVAFTEAQRTAMLYGNEQERAATLAEAVTNSVGNMNEVMAQMPEGKIEQAGNAWDSMKEVIGTALYPAVINLCNAISTKLPAMAPIFTVITSGVGILVDALAGIIDIVGSISSFVAENWGVIAPILLAMIAIIGLLTVVIKKKTIADMLSAASSKAAAAATKAWSAVQSVFNTIMNMNPLNWVIIAIIAIIAAIFAAVSAVNKATGSTLTVLGVICGAIASAGAIIWNIVAGIINGIIQFLWAWFVEPWIGIIEWVLNVFNGGFDSFGDAVKNLLGNIIGWFLSLGTVVTKIIDAIFGTNWTEGLSELKANVEGWGKSESSITLDRDAPFEIERKEIGDAWNAGNEFGDGLQEKLGSFTGGSDTENLISNYTMGSVNTDELMSTVNSNNQNSVNSNSTTNNVTYDFSGMSNTYNNTSEKDNVLGDLEGYLSSRVASGAEGA